jgi:FMN phosphatase YigB (HAD superfamily)
MDKGIILFDIDRTIFDTTKFRDVITSGTSRIIGNVTTKEIEDALSRFISSLQADREFDPEKFTKFVCETFSFDNQSKLLDVFYGKDNQHWYKDFVFSEFFSVSKTLGEKFKLGIYSEGTKIFQNYKFKSMEISEYLDKDLIFILDNKTNPSAISKIPSGAVVIDDKESVCEYLKNNKIKAIWLNRKTKDKNSGFTTIHSLTELPGILL